MVHSLNNAAVKIGTRGSPLALAQADEVIALLRRAKVQWSFEKIIYKTAGDRDLKTPLSDKTPDDYFTDVIDQALLSGEIDIAIHSAKDVPQKLKSHLAIFALTKPLDETDALVGRTALSQMKPGSKVGTSSPLRKSAVAKINPGLTIVPIRGTIRERIKMVEREIIDGVIVATCALKRLGLSYLIKDILPFDAMPLQGQLAVVGRICDFRMRKIFSAIDVRRRYGTVTLVGAGPGDPELITIKAIHALKKSDVVFYDYLVDPKLLAYAPRAEKIYVGKRKGGHTLSQSDLSRMLRDQARSGKNVVRLKGGDPLIFGRGPSEMEYLWAYHIPVDVVPGVSSATGIPSTLGIPLTARGLSSSVAFLSAHGEDEKDSRPRPIKIPKTDTLVFLMGLTKLNTIVKSLRATGWNVETPMIIISKGTYAEEKIVCGTIGTIEALILKDPVDPPALMVVGNTVKFWQERRKKEGTILYLGTNPQKYKALGNVVHLPMIKILAIPFSRDILKRLHHGLEEYSLIILTSRFAVKYFMALLNNSRYANAKLKGMDFAVVGKDTAKELKKFKLTAKVIAHPETGEGLLEALTRAYDLKGMKILFPRSSLPNPFLKTELTRRGALVTELTVYENQKPPIKDFSFQGVDKVIFTSPSTVKNFLEDFGMIPHHWQIFAKGPVTQKVLAEAGYESEILIE